MSAPAWSSAIALSKSNGPHAAATKKLPSLSLAAFGYCDLLRISLIVMIPTNLPSRTTGSLSTLLSYAIFNASSAETPSSTVTTSEVIISLIFVDISDFKNGLISLFEIIPSISSPSTTGNPLMSSSRIIVSASATVES